MVNAPRRLIIGISGASGAIYGIRLLQILQETDVETHLILTKPAKITISHETDLKISAVTALADVCHDDDNIAAPVASGSFGTHGMIIAPCSMRSAAEIAHGTTTTLLTRAADVVLKEQRRLVIMARETPLHLGHLRTLTALAEMGAVVAPPMPAFYAKPESISDLVDHSVGRVLDLFGIDAGIVRRWGEDASR